MKNKTHHLKTWRKPYKDIDDRIKSFEVRKNDRDYKVGDSLWLYEWDQKKEQYTGSRTLVTITYIMQGVFGLPDEICVMGIKHPETDPFFRCFEYYRKWLIGINKIFVADIDVGPK